MVGSEPAVTLLSNRPPFRITGITPCDSVGDASWCLEIDVKLRGESSDCPSRPRRAHEYVGVRN